MITHENRKFKTKVIDKVPEDLSLLTSASIEIKHVYNEDWPVFIPIYEIYGDIHPTENEDEIKWTPLHITIYDRECAIQILNLTNNSKRLLKTVVTVNYPNPIDRATRNILEKGDSNYEGNSLHGA